MCTLQERGRRSFKRGRTENYRYESRAILRRLKSFLRDRFDRNLDKKNRSTNAAAIQRVQVFSCDRTG